MRCKTKGLKLCLSINLTEYVHGCEMNCTQLKKSIHKLVFSKKYSTFVDNVIVIYITLSLFKYMYYMLTHSTLYSKQTSYM